MSDWDPSDRFEDWPGCRACIHFELDRARKVLTCTAYPDGIPMPLLAGDADHMVERPGQVVGVLFTPKEGTDAGR